MAIYKQTNRKPILFMDRCRVLSSLGGPYVVSIVLRWEVLFGDACDHDGLIRTMSNGALRGHYNAPGC